MANYEALDFKEFLKTFNYTDTETLQNAAAIDIIESKWERILDYIKIAGTGAELNIKVKAEKEEATGKLEFMIDVQHKFKKIKNTQDYVQDDTGKIFLENPNQQVMPGVLEVGTTENKK